LIIWSSSSRLRCGVSKSSALNCAPAALHLRAKLVEALAEICLRDLVPVDLGDEGFVRGFEISLDAEESAEDDDDDAENDLGDQAENLS
jgi:hypothetical protein